jgi:hypothetical protein
VTTIGGFEETTTATWTVTAYEDGQATEMTETGITEGSVTPRGRAEDCELPEGGVTGTAQLEGSITRG